MLFIEQFVRIEAVIAQKPIRLIESVLAQKRRFSCLCGQKRILDDRDIRRIEHALELVFFIERRGERHYLIVAVGRCADYQLRALTAGGETRRVLISDKLRRALFYLICNKPHRAEYRLLCFVRRESLQAVVRRQLDIDAHSVREHAETGYQRVIRARDRLGVDISAEPVFFAQDAQSLNHTLAGIIGTADDGGREEKPLDIIAAIKIHRQLRELTRRKGRAADIVGDAVDAIFAVKNAGIAHENFQQRYKSAVRREAVAYAARGGVAYPLAA